MSDIIQEAVKYCTQQDYFISVHKDSDKNGCLAIFPSQTIFHNRSEAYSIFYEITNIGLKYFYTIDGNEPKVTELECPEYSRRVLIFQDLLNRALGLSISTKLILYYNEKGEEVDTEGLISCLNGPVDEHERELEDNFANLFYYFLSNPDKDYSSLAQRCGIGSGYNLLTLPFLRKDFE
jgi:hypothetical protein